MLHGELIDFKFRIIKEARSVPLHDCKLLDFYNELRQIYKIPGSVILYIADDGTFGWAFASLNLLRRESAIFLWNEFAGMLSRNVLRFVLAHEVGHVLDRKKNLLSFFFSGYSNIQNRDLLADAFAARVIGKRNAIVAIEELLTLFEEDESDKIATRLMALYMPTLFFKYA